MRGPAPERSEKPDVTGNLTSGMQVLSRSAWLRLFPVLCTALAILVLVFLPTVTLAQEAAEAGGTVDAMIDQMSQTLTTLGKNAGQAARSLLLILFGVDLVLRFGRWALQGSTFDEVWGTWLYQLTFVCIVYVLVLMVPEVVTALTKLAMKFASTAGSADVEPTASGMITDGLSRAVGWVKAIDFWTPSTWLFLSTAILSIVVTAMTVAFLVITYAEIYLIGLAGIIVLGFAGLQETRAASVSYIRLLIGKALKLMALMIVYGAVATLTTALAQDASTGTGGALGMIMLQIIAALLIISLPGTVEGLVSNIGASSAEGAAKYAGTMAQNAMMIAGKIGIAAAIVATKMGGGQIAKTLGKAGGKQALDTLKNAATPGSSPGSSDGGRMSATEALGGKAAADLQAKISKAIGSGGGNDKDGEST